VSSSLSLSPVWWWWFVVVGLDGIFVLEHSGWLHTQRFPHHLLFRPRHTIITCLDAPHAEAKTLRLRPITPVTDSKLHFSPVLSLNNRIMPSLLIYRVHCHGQGSFTLRIVRRSRSTDTRHSAHSDRETNNLLSCTSASATSLVVLSYRRFQPYIAGIETGSTDAVTQEPNPPESNDCRTTRWWC